MLEQVVVALLLMGVQLVVILLEQAVQVVHLQYQALL
jgi:hypothetical protein